MLSLSDMLMITATTDATLICAGQRRTIRGVRANFGIFAGRRRGCEPGVRDTLADMGQTIAQNFGATIPHWEEFP